MKNKTVSMTSLLNSLRAASEQTRLRLLAILDQSELTVSELGRILGQSTPRVSRHLKVLCENHLLERYQEGSWVFYRIAEHGPAAHIARALLDLLPNSDLEIERDNRQLDAIRKERAELASSYFEKNAKSWDEIRELYISEEKIENILLQEVADKPVDFLLDLGTGTGRILEVFSPHITRGLGVDYSREMLTVARTNLENAGITNCSVRQSDVQNLVMDSDSADIAIFHHVLHFMDNPAPAIVEAVRVVRPGGKVVVVDFSPHQLEFLREEHAHRKLGFSDEEISGWMAGAGAPVCRMQRLTTSKAKNNQLNLTVTIWIGEVNSASTNE